MAPKTPSISIVAKGCLVACGHYHLFIFFQRTNRSLISPITSDSLLMLKACLFSLSSSYYQEQIIDCSAMVCPTPTHVISLHPLMGPSQSLEKISKESWNHAPGQENSMKAVDAFNDWERGLMSRGPVGQLHQQHTV